MFNPNRLPSSEHIGALGPTAHLVGQTRRSRGAPPSPDQPLTPHAVPPHCHCVFRKYGGTEFALFDVRIKLASQRRAARETHMTPRATTELDGVYRRIFQRL